MKFSSPTEGASIAYTTEEGKTARWLLFTGEVTLKRAGVLRVKACRLGYLDSEEVLKRF
jgi:N-sulfoglucosamine sulfohydrolase